MNLTPLADKIDALVEAYKASHQDDKQKSDKILFWNRWTALFTAFAFAAAGIYAGINYEQWRDLQRNFAVDQRAWVKVEAAIPETVTIPAWRIAMWNTGKTPVTETGLLATFEIVDKDKGPHVLVEPRVVTAGIYGPIFPGQHAEADVRLDPNIIKFTDTQRDQLLSGEKYISVWGKLQYRDSFGLHWTRFCFWKGYGPEGATYDASNCTTYSAIGEGGVLKITNDYKDSQ